MTVVPLLNQITLLLAQGRIPGAGAEEPRNYAISWAIILLSVILGLVVVLRVPKRADKVVKPKPD